MKEIFTFDSTIITHRTVNTKGIEGTDFVFYEDFREINEDGISRTEVYKGVTSLENIKKVTGTKAVGVKAPKMYDGCAVVAAIDKNDYMRLRVGDLYIEDVIKQIKDIDYSEDTHILVLYDFASRRIADLNYRFISIPIHFGYIGAQVDNSQYDLVRLLEKLKNDKHVCHRDQIKISNIPYYNRDEERQQSIEFNYLLSDSVYNMLASKGKINNKVYILDNIIGAKEFKNQKG